MNNQKPQIYFLLVLLSITVILSFFILRPFIFAIVLALVFSVIFQPLYNWMIKYSFKHDGLAAFLTTLIIILLIFIPLSFLIIQILQEAKDLYVSLLSGGGREGLLDVFNKFAYVSHGYLPDAKEISANIDQYLKEALSWVLNNLGSFFSNFISLLMTAFLFIISLYYMLKDGNRLRKRIISLSPLKDMDDQIIIKKIEMAINSVVKGKLVIAFIQGVLTAAGFAIFGVPGPVLWGTVASVAALIPNIGTSLILIPAIIFLFINGQIFSAVGLVLWGILVVGLIDNFLGPKLISKGMQLHPLLVLFSVLGGMIFFGPIGFILGPIVLSLLFALLDIYFYVAENKKITD